MQCVIWLAMGSVGLQPGYGSESSFRVAHCEAHSSALGCNAFIVLMLCWWGSLCM